MVSCGQFHKICIFVALAKKLAPNIFAQYFFCFIFDGVCQLMAPVHRESNPGQLGIKCKHYLCAMPPLEHVFTFRCTTMLLCCMWPKTSRRTPTLEPSACRPSPRVRTSLNPAAASLQVRPYPIRSLWFYFQWIHISTQSNKLACPFSNICCLWQVFLIEKVTSEH